MEKPGRGEVEGGVGKTFRRNSYCIEKIGAFKTTTYWNCTMRLTSSASDMERLRYMCLMNIAGCDWGRSGSRRGRRFWPPALLGAVLGGQGCNGFTTSGRGRPSLT